MDENTRHAFFALLNEGLLDDLDHERPLLAHYTSIENLENIVRSNELWLSHPFVMNDHEEVSFGIRAGVEVFEDSSAIESAAASPARRERFLNGLRDASQRYWEQHLFDTYVFCFSQHDPADCDGSLPMWRGYGGRGKGAAVVFDTARIQTNAASPLIIAKVHYASPNDRRDWLNELASKVGQFIASTQIMDDDLYALGADTFERIKLAAIFSKHIGFRDEHEWRMVYMPDRDSEGWLRPHLHYHNGVRGIEPKLRLPVRPGPGVTGGALSLNTIVDRIIIGPTRVSPLIHGSTARMLALAGQPELASRLLVSKIPFRGE